MFFPIGDDQVQGGHTPYVAYGFIALNILIFIFQFQMGPQDGQAFVNDWGAVPARIQNGESIETLLTSAFLHGGWAHLLGNMLYMWIFADNVEATIGSAAFLIFYLLGAVAANFCHIYFNLGSTIPAVGASGALSAVMGAYIVMFPRSNVRGFLIFFAVNIPAWIFLAFWFWQQSSAGYRSLGEEAGTGIAWWAHIGGFVFGVLAGLFFRTRYHIPRAKDGFRSRRNRPYV